MEQQLEEIREQQKASWNKFSPGWKKWDDLTMDFLKPMGDEIIRALDVQAGDVVLDVAAGTGEPGLTIASRLSTGRVVITDLADDMLVVARENAARRGIHNVEMQACDVCELPFADNTFDAISCRFGFMFFPDMALAAREMYRVLKPGGRMATAVWNVPEKNFWVTAVMGAINRNLNLPAPPPGAPGMFRCAKDGLIAGLLTEAGFRNVSQQEVAGTLNARTADTYWEMMNDIAAPVVAGLSKADDDTRDKIKAEVYQAVQQKYPHGDILIDSSALVVCGER
ncbi:MAG TPA: class I SAM-dependent methyltransferase [Hymenobacter sp.]|jgi:ubiquinone/menaquinone biosynthesis C-methylase UbiE|uniref:class I SAM-dependent methyltransferase n=1 Tax=Hymenobacter sp. TaxID=1898978 RepID=UPI002EDB9CFA